MKLYQFILAGFVGAGLLVAAVYWIARGKTARVEGSITEVRTLGMDRNSAVAIVDFEFTNRSKALVMIGDRDLVVIDQDESVHEASFRIASSAAATRSRRRTCGSFFATSRR